jgi:hypothetical protein
VRHLTLAYGESAMREEKTNDTAESGGDEHASVPTVERPTLSEAELADVAKMFEEARERVRPLVEREAQAEVLTDDVLNFRLGRM